MKRRKLRVKRIVILILIIIIPVFTSVIYTNFLKLNVKYNKQVKVEINSKVYNLDNIKKVEHGKVVTKKKQLNSSKLGNTKVEIKVKPNLQKVKTYSYNVKVVDTVKPEIKVEDKISVHVGSDIDLSNYAEASDNSKEQIQVQVLGDYDLNQIGSYKIQFVAKDSSGNKTEKEVLLDVVDQSVEVNSQVNNHTITEKDGVTYIDGILIANKTYSLPSTYNPGGLTKETMNAFNDMAADAKSVGLNLHIVSGFRSYDEQNTLYNSYVSRDGKEAADTYSARPGHSEHQSGLAFDLNLVNASFEYTNEGKWLNDNCYRFGFILRYPKNKTNETGYIYEAWHFRYVGVDLATKLYNNGDWITLEKYFGLTSEYNY